MATYNLGQLAIVNKGAWASGTSYAMLNTVTHNGGSFMAIAANNSVEPGVSSGWANSWVPMSKGIKTIDIVAGSGGTAHAVITLSDGTSVTGSDFSTAGVAPGGIGPTELATGAVTATKQGFIKFGTGDPTQTPSLIPNDGEIYLKYEA